MQGAMTSLNTEVSLPPSGGRRWDCVALGEVMLRLDPGEGRIRSTREFRVWEGGGEYNVARGLRKTFRRPTAVLTALPRNEIGLLVEDLILQGGVDTSRIIWREYDDVGRNTRVGLNFTERGFGVRAALGVSDRAHSAASQIESYEFDWDALFGTGGTRWLHTGGIFAALSESTARTTLSAVRHARRHGVAVSYDLNYRASLWNSHPDPDAARQVNRAIAAECDLLIGDEFSFASCLGLESNGTVRATPMDSAPADAESRRVFESFPNLKLVAFPLRDARSASRNAWGGVLHARDGRRCDSLLPHELDILDRVGGGDAFVAGLIHGLLDGVDLQRALDLGVAHGALAMTTSGDNAMTSLGEIEAVIRGDGAVARR
jgi:2-dehydro-3-deoxygluconokinase